MTSRHPLVRFLVLVAAAALWAAPAGAQTCQPGKEMDAATRNAMEGAAQRYFQYSAAGDHAGLRQAAIPAVAQNFGAIETAVAQHRPQFEKARAQVRSSFLLDAPGRAPLQRAQFYCGVWRMPDWTAFVIPNLPPGRYGLVILDVASEQGHTLSTVLQQDSQSGQWRLAGYYVRPKTLAGHDGQWYWLKAREFAQKGQRHNAWFYYLAARELLAPVPFMSTMELDRLYGEGEKIQPEDLPSERPLELSADGRAHRITEMFPVEVGDDLNLVVRHQVADISDTRQTYQDNMALIRALVARYPELREGFTGVVARAVEPGGRDFGSLLAMKDVK